MGDKYYTYDQVLEASIEYFNGDLLAADVFVDKYALKNGKDFLELTPKDTHKRLAKEFARIESKYSNAMSEDEIFDLFDKFKYIIPQGSPMSAIGNPFQIQSCGNCFVVESPYDSYGGILKTDQEIVQIAKRRGGVGFCISNIRPRGLVTKNAAKTTDGISVFMERFSNSINEVAQEGRRGAGLQCIDVAHPEIKTFINSKRDTTKITGTNISILFSDEFLNAVKNKEKFKLHWPINSNNPTIEQEVEAQEIWDEFIDSAWSSAEPGSLFIDTIRRNSIPDLYADKDSSFRTIACNPCGELVMGVDSCRLMLLNTFSFVDNPFTDQATFNYDKFYDYAIKAQRLMDDMTDIEIELIDKILAKIYSDPEPDDVKFVEKNLWENFKKTCIAGRRTGLGVTGVGDTLAALNITYGSDESIDKVESIYKTLALGAHKSSCILAQERGAFPLFDFDLENNSDCPYLKRIWEADPSLKEMTEKYGRRNIALTTTPPAGSMSIEAGVTSGIECLYLIEYNRRRKLHSLDTHTKDFYTDEEGIRWIEYNVVHNKFNLWKDITGKSDPKESPYYNATYDKINWINKIKMQAVAQKWVSHSISNTANIPRNTSKEVVSQIYMTAFDSGCKGVTIYREGSRKGILSDVSFDDDGRPLSIQHSQSPKRPNILPCEIHYSTVMGVKWVILVGLLKDYPYEIFMGESDKFNIPKKYIYGKIIKVKNGKYNLLSNDDQILINNIVQTADNEDGAWTTRIMSMSLRHGIPVEYLVEQLSKDGSMVDVNNVLARLLKRYIKKRKDTGVDNKEKCPKCGSTDLIYSESCVKCPCGWGGCG